MLRGTRLLRNTAKNAAPNNNLARITGIPKAPLLAALYNNVRQSARFSALDRLTLQKNPMTVEQAQSLLSNLETAGRRADLDYVKGKPIKIDFSKDEIDVSLYNRDYGP